MEYTLVLLMKLNSCPPTVVVNATKVWNKIDQKTLKTSQKRCIVHYKDAPCLKRFIKKEENNYWAICGTREKTKN